jgi:hypothetical protein
VGQVPDLPSLKVQAEEIADLVHKAIVVLVPKADPEATGRAAEAIAAKVDVPTLAEADGLSTALSTSN